VERKVLIVEDDPRTRELLVREFSGSGFRVLATADGTSALFQLGIAQPHAMIVSTCLPDRDGWETLRRARELSDVPIIALVAHDDEQARISSLRQGADHSVTKPPSPRELRARVCALLRRTKQMSSPPLPFVPIDDPPVNHRHLNLGVQDAQGLDAKDVIGEDY
jgi:DNA-binding response OmpR family regulator